MDQFVNFLQEWGIFGLVILVASYGITALVKIPLKKVAEKYALKNGVDKSVITLWFALIPIVIAFIGSIFHQWGKAGWGSAIASPEFSWTDVMVETFAIGMTAIAIYEIYGNVKKAFTSKAIKADADATNQAVKEAYKTLEESAVTEADKVKTQKKIAKLQARQEKAEKAKLEQIQKLEAQLSSLKTLKVDNVATTEKAETKPTEEASSEMKRIN